MSVTLKRRAKGKGDTRRALLADRLRKATQPAIPLSFAQQRLWFLDQLEPNSPLYNVPTLVKMSGSLNVEALQEALAAIVARHESLRTRFVEVDGNPTQVPVADLRLNVLFHDLTGAPLSAAQSLVSAEVNRPFDLSSGPPIRATLIRVQPDEHWLVLNLHHIVSDEWSLNICFQELTELYTSFLEGRKPELPNLPIQYADYTLWQRDWLKGDVLGKQLSYWREKLRGNPPILELAPDRPRPAMQTFRGGIQKRILPSALSESLTQLGASHGATLFMVTLAAFKALLYRYTQQEDIVIGSPIAGRNRVETERLIGFFVNTLLLRTDVSGDPAFVELLRRVRETTLNAHAHGDIPFEKLVENLHPERAATHMPFARIMFAVQNTMTEHLEWPDLKLQLCDAETETAKFDFTLVLQVSERGLVAQAEYNRHLFDSASVDRLLEHFEILLEGIIDNPQQRLSELPLLSQAEHRQVVFEWNKTKTTYPREKCIHELFEAQVEKNPHAVAVLFEKQSLTYQELNHRANRLAHYLKKYSVGPDMLVGICVERSVEMIVGMLAILKAGAGYVPIEAGYPRERFTFMLADAGVPVLLTQQRLVSLLPRPVNTLCLDSDWELIARESRENLPRCASPENLAYVIYTSGSTGTPKGVAVPHRAVNRLVLNTNYIHLSADDRVAQVSNASFDAVTFEVWGALLNGGALIGITRDVTLSPGDFARELREQNISAMFLTAALFNQLVAEVPDAFATVRTVIFGGEAGDPKSVARVLKARAPRHLVNGYGPTENTTFSACYEVRAIADDATNVPIGGPIANSQCYILDRHLNPMPIGVPGELHVGGDGLARGYWNRSQLTAQKFIRHPFEPGQLLYKTGDLARWLPDGNIEFLGRLDQQVKIRGFRIELGEIETVLSRHPAIRECVVITHKDETNHDRLVAYFVAGKRVPSFGELLRFLKDRIPDYMVPSAFVPLDVLPLTPNGKVDRKALPEPGKDRPQTEAVATPRDAVELKLTEIWENVLNVHPIGIEDGFFDLGGHSLLAIKLVAQIEKVFGRRLRVATLFQAPTIEQLAAIIREEIQEGSALAGTSLVEIQSQGSRPPLFLIHGAGGGMFWGYVNLSRHLGTDQPVYGLKSRGLDGGEELGSIEEMATQYVADVRALQPHGPYYLGGYCFGGNVALEMARQFRAQGEEVALLALLNCSPPNSDYDRISWAPAWFLRFGRNLLYWADYFRRWTPAQRRDFFRWKKDILKQRIRHWFGGDGCAASKVDAGNLVDLSSFPADQRELWRTHIRSLLNYHPKPYTGRVHLFRSPGHPLLCSFQADYGWEALAESGVEINIVPGVHEKILEEPCVRALAKELKSCIERVSSFTPVELSRRTLPRADSQSEVAALAGTVLWGEHKEFPLEQTCARHFEEQAAKTPNGIALRCPKRNLTYAELNSRANRLAHHLQALGVGPESLVALGVQRSLESIVALLAILKAGGAHLPLDPSSPRERLSRVVAEAQPCLLLTQTGLCADLKMDGVKVICMDDPEQARQIGTQPEDNPTCSATLDNLGCVIYTSAPREIPDGVAITQRSLLNHHLAVAQAYGLNPADRVLFWSPLGFAISIEEVFPALLRGCSVVLQDDEALCSMAEFMEFVAREQITVLKLPTPCWHEMVDYLQTALTPPSLRLVIVGGGKPCDEAWRCWKFRIGEAVKLINTYGTAETTFTATIHVARLDDEFLPIGKPIPNDEFAILDHQLEPVTAGETGELYIGGTGLALGYWKRPDLTAQRFISGTSNGNGFSRLYKTGDLARVRPDGVIECMGWVSERMNRCNVGLSAIEHQQSLQPSEEEQHAYWTRQLKDAPALLDLPADRPRPAQRSGAFARHPVLLAREIAESVEELSKTEECSGFVVLLAAFQTLLSRYTGATDIVVGSAVNTRPGGDSRGTNLIAHRSEVSGDMDFRGILRPLRETVQGAYLNGGLPFERLVRELLPENPASYSPVFQVMFNYGPEMQQQISNLDLALHLVKTPDGLSGWIEYSTDLYDANRIARMAEHYSVLLTAAVKDPSRRLSSLPLMSEAELRNVLVEWNANEKEYPRQATLSQLFEAQAKRSPDAIALVDGTERLSYAELNARANQIAHRLRSLDVGPGKLVGICAKRSWRMLAGILGVLKAGGAYVPLDPAYPKDRLAFILDDAKAPVLLTDQELDDLRVSEQTRVIRLDLDWPEIQQQSRENPGAAAGGEDLAYVIYTSGSTGKPKGVALEHRNAVALMHWARDVFTNEDLAGVLASTSICFDLSVFEMFVPLSWGGTVILAENALALPGLPAAGEITLINTVPSAIRELLRVKGVPPGVRIVNLAGEPLITPLVDQIYSQTGVQKVYDLYGPSETTTYSTFTLRKPGEPASIGRPLANEQVYLLDKNLQPVSIGIPGEIYIGGNGVARGYLNRPELTAERFIANPLAGRHGVKAGRLYKTGDLARWRADGNLEFLGRMDHQVKIRGFRIELGEIESVLRKDARLRESVVVVREDRPGDKRLVAYVVRKPDAQLVADELRRFAREALPEYMVPSAIVFLEALPLTPNGKVDRKALPAPEPDCRAVGAEFVEPVSITEQELAAIWREVLGVRRIGTNDNFFELGGHSLLAIQVISRVREKFNVEPPLNGLFDAPTIQELARALDGGKWGQSAVTVSPMARVSRDGHLPLSSVQERLWFLDQVSPGGHAYNMPLALRLAGVLDVFALQRALNEVVRRHEALRTKFVNDTGRLSQVIAPPAELQIEVCNLEFTPATEREEKLQAWLNAEAQRPFDLSRAPLIRVKLGRLGATEHVLSVVMHHAISDGWSQAIFFRELEAFYRAFAANEPAPQIPELRVQYADFAHWQREWMQGAKLKQELEYWKGTLEGAPGRVRLPMNVETGRVRSLPDGDWQDKSGAQGIRLRPTSARQVARPTSDRFMARMHELGSPELPAERPTGDTAYTSAKAGRLVEKFSPATPEALAAFSHRENATPFMVLMTALAITLEKWAGQQDMVIGTVVAGRTRREVENIIGCFMNFLPIRVRLNEDETGRALLARVKSTVLEAQAHQDCPFEKIVEAVNPERRLNQNPLYNVALLLQNFPAQFFTHKSLQVTSLCPDVEAAQLDLRFEAEFSGQYLALICEYKTDLFSTRTIEQLLVSCRGVLETLLKNPGAKLAEFAITDALLAQARSAQTPAIEQKIAIAATFTAEPVEESLKYWMNQLELPAKIEFAGFNQVFQELLDPAGVLAKNTRGINVVLVRLEDLGDSTEKVERGARELISAIRGASARMTTPLLVVLCPPKPQRGKTFDYLENTIAAELDKLAGVYVVTAAGLLEFYPVSDFYDGRGDELGCVPYTPLFFAALGTLIARKFHALQRAAPKVIVLDCDQTLWGGVCGEDGPRGICLDAPRQALQEFMRAQHAAGRLLAVCSKNNEEDVREVFAQRLDMPLRREHFATWRLNWSPKSENLKSIARELNLSMDSFIFVDDNPVECAEVESQCPEVLTLQLPENPKEIPQFLKHCWAFDVIKLTAEDARRTEMYRESRQREELRTQAGSLADFLAGLNLQIQIATMTPEQLPRVSQLTHRTNQFNLTTIRRTEAEIQQVAGKAKVLTVSVSDRFGDYGLVGVMICEASDEALDIETFLLSCRVLGRGVEHEMLAHLGNLACEQKKRRVNVHFHPSAKNKPALDFLQSVGAQFKQALNGGFVYVFPAEFAAEITLNPEGLPHIPADGTNTRDSQSVVTSTATCPKFSLCRTIAVDFNDAASIHRAIEGKPQIRSGRQAGYLAPRTETERQICELWQKLLRIDRVGVKDNFFELGGHSLLAVRLFADLEKLTGHKLPLVTIFQAPTVEELARAAAGSQATGARSVLVPVQANGKRPPLFLVHGAGGDVLWGYANLARHMHPEQPIYGIKSRGQVGLEEYEQIEDMARYYLEEVRTLQPHGPYFLGGYCFGGNVAYEMARQLRSQGEAVAQVLLIDATPSNAGYERILWWRPSFYFRFTSNLFYWLKDFVTLLEPAEQRRYIVRKARVLARKIARKLNRGKKSNDVDLDEVIDVQHFPDSELKFWQIHLNALVAHVERPYPGAVTLLRTRGQAAFCSFAEDFCWGTLAHGGVAVKHIPGSHENIFTEPNVKFLAQTIEECLTAENMRAKSEKSLSHELV